MSNEREFESFEDWHKRVKWPSLPSAFHAGAEWQRSQQSAPAGWQLVKVNEGFDTLVNALERADRKGYLADSLIEPWETFDYEYVAAAPKAEQPPVQQPVGYGNPAAFIWKDFTTGKQVVSIDRAPHGARPLYAAPQPVSDDAKDALVEALEVLAKLGNGEHYGNSDGNVIAQMALAAYRAAMGSE